MICGEFEGMVGVNAVQELECARRLRVWGRIESHVVFKYGRPARAASQLNASTCEFANPNGVWSKWEGRPTIANDGDDLV